MGRRVVQLAIGLAGFLLLAISVVEVPATEVAASQIVVSGPGQARLGTYVPACDPNWTVVDSPYVTSPTTTQLTGVAVVGANDVWAVGYYLSGNAWQTFIVHWNGASWEVVESPNASLNYNILTGVVAISANDVWAVGYYLESGSYRTLTEHWNGKAWSVVASPNVGTSNSFLLGVSAVSASDIWAVGKSGGTFESTLTEHWNGTAWSIVASESPGTQGNSLAQVEAIASNNVWAVGSYNDKEGSIDQTLIEHWDGSAWSIVSSPNMGTGSNALRGVVSASASDVWAVGYYLNGGVYSTLIEHWNGSAWSVVPSPNSGTGSSYLIGATLVSASDIWAVGYYYDGLVSRTLTEHWNGSAWSVVSSPNVGAENNQLEAVAAVGGGDVWGVGYYSNEETVIQTLAEHWNGSAWSVVPTPNGIGTSNQFRGIEAITSDDIWAVGNTATGSLYHALVEHWDVTAWNVVSIPDTGNPGSALFDVSALSSSDVWAVGWYFNGISNRTLTMHWNGSAWSVVTSPNIGVYSELYGVFAVSASDVWAVGNYYNDVLSADQTLTMHWNGTAWSIVPSPNLTSNSHYLNEVTALASNDVWAVGSYLDVALFMYRTYTLHWNGSVWSVVSSPNASEIDNYIYGVTAIASNDIWAVGHWGFQTAFQTVIMHWNGSAWSLVPSPSPGAAASYLFGVVGLAGNDVWAVGHSNDGGPNKTLIEHWNGTAWTVATNPNPGSVGNDLEAVAAVSGSDVWAVGGFSNSTFTKSLVERYNPCQGSPTPTQVVTGTLQATLSPTRTNTPVAPSVTALSTSTLGLPTQTPGGPTATIGPPTSTSTIEATAEPTAIATATVCAISFSDVGQDNAFYVFIRCLACRGIISGYADGTFRPGNDITRGQIAKIVSNAAGYEDDVFGRQTYADVPDSETFWLWVERLSAHAVMGGYDCGGVGEPCDGENRPYFRPFANATRGQLAKIVANAAGLGGTPGGQFYTDVPESHPFYLWIMRLTDLGAMSGYTCGGEGEPCDGESRSYFRPFNNVTRGQASKIVGNTFFPGCQTPSGR